MSALFFSRARSRAWTHRCGDDDGVIIEDTIGLLLPDIVPPLLLLPISRSPSVLPPSPEDAAAAMSREDDDTDNLERGNALVREEKNSTSRLRRSVLVCCDGGVFGWVRLRREGGGGEVKK